MRGEQINITLQELIFLANYDCYNCYNYNSEIIVVIITKVCNYNRLYIYSFLHY